MIDQNSLNVIQDEDVRKYVQTNLNAMVNEVEYKRSEPKEMRTRITEEQLAASVTDLANMDLGPALGGHRHRTFLCTGF